MSSRSSSRTSRTAPGRTCNVTQLVAADAAVRAHMPANGTLGTSWTQAAFADGSWTTGTQGAGFESSVPGFGVTNHKAVGGVPSLAEAESVIATPAKRSATYLENRGVINYFNSGGDGHYGNNITFPGLSFNVDVDDFVVEAVGTVTIPAAGNWTFGVNSDDGFGLTVGTFSDLVSIATRAGRYARDLQFSRRGRLPDPARFLRAGRRLGRRACLRRKERLRDGRLRSSSSATRQMAGSRCARTRSARGGYRALIGTDLQSAMLGVNASAYVRIPFTVADAVQLQSLTLKAKYDDGFVAYVNGVKVAERNAPASPTWNSHRHRAACERAGRRV